MSPQLFTPCGEPREESRGRAALRRWRALFHLLPQTLLIRAYTSGSLGDSEARLLPSRNLLSSKETIGDDSPARRDQETHTHRRSVCQSDFMGSRNSHKTHRGGGFAAMETAFGLGLSLLSCTLFPRSLTFAPW